MKGQTKCNSDDGQDSVCVSCALGDIDIMRKSGYTDDQYIFCSKCDDIISVKQECAAWVRHEERGWDAMTPEEQIEIMKKIANALIEED